MKKIISLLLVVFILSALCGFAVSADAINTYIVGDADGDGVVSIIDATTIQRFLVELITDDDGMLTLRGDVDSNGLDILDATSIQRYLADYVTNKPIGEIVEITAPTQPATQNPTTDPDELPFVPIK